MRGEPEYNSRDGGQSFEKDFDYAADQKNIFDKAIRGEPGSRKKFEQIQAEARRRGVPESKIKYCTRPAATKKEDLTPLDLLSEDSRRVYLTMMDKFNREVGLPSEEPPTQEYFERVERWINEPKSTSSRSIRRLSVLRATGLDISYDYRYTKHTRISKLRKTERTEEDFRRLYHALEVAHVPEDQLCIAALCWYLGIRSSEVTMLKIKKSNDKIYLDLTPLKGGKKRNIEISQLLENNPILIKALRYWVANYRREIPEVLNRREAKRLQSEWARQVRLVDHDSGIWSYHALRHAAIARERQRLIDDVLSRPKVREKLKNTEPSDFKWAYLSTLKIIEKELCKWSGHQSSDSARAYGSSDLYRKMRGLVPKS